jgi:hypothetical protein
MTPNRANQGYSIATTRVNEIAGRVDWPGDFVIENRKKAQAPTSTAYILAGLKGIKACLLGD